ncbi:hypothetical protein PVAP13_5KG192007 [Panicum virgatum]|uniref:Uncharacterized protein n=1 Tax=Panicum virgatum TaxID=38727 RepID=A0A8T0SG31_PANVG|nr:hypothetical protein PVAP13_5KG192007 [Panicum virgatum]
MCRHGKYLRIRNLLPRPRRLSSLRCGTTLRPRRPALVPARRQRRCSREVAPAPASASARDPSTLSVTPQAAGQALPFPTLFTTVKRARRPGAPPSAPPLLYLPSPLLMRPQRRLVAPPFTSSHASPKAAGRTSLSPSPPRAPFPSPLSSCVANGHEPRRPAGRVGPPARWGRRAAAWLRPRGALTWLPAAAWSKPLQP